MKEKEELSAYVVLGLDPYRYLAMPRFFAFLTMIPCLTAISNALALIGGWIVCVLALDITTYTYSTGMQYLFDNMDLWAGIIKSIVFGTIIFVPQTDSACVASTIAIPDWPEVGFRPVGTQECYDIPFCSVL